MRKRTTKRTQMLMALSFLVIYVILKIYVLNTADLKDDPLPDLILNALVKSD